MDFIRNVSETFNLSNKSLKVRLRLGYAGTRRFDYRLRLTAYVRDMGESNSVPASVLGYEGDRHGVTVAGTRPFF